jgi:hypothetical protein
MPLFCSCRRRPDIQDKFDCLEPKTQQQREAIAIVSALNAIVANGMVTQSERNVLLNNRVTTINAHFNDLHAAIDNLKTKKEKSNPSFYQLLCKNIDLINEIVLTNYLSIDSLLLMDTKKLKNILLIMGFYKKTQLEEHKVSLAQLQHLDDHSLSLLNKHFLKVMTYRKHYTNFNVFMKDANYFEIFVNNEELIDSLLEKNFTFGEIKQVIPMVGKSKEDLKNILLIMRFYKETQLEEHKVSLEELQHLDYVSLFSLARYGPVIMKYRKHYANFNAFMKDKQYFEIFLFNDSLLDLLIERNVHFKDIKHAIDIGIIGEYGFDCLYQLIKEGFSFENITSITTKNARTYILMNSEYIISYKQKHPEITPDAIIKMHNDLFDLLVEKKVHLKDIMFAVNIGVINNHFYFLHLMIIEGFSLKSITSIPTIEARKYILMNYANIISYKQKHPEMTPDAIIKKHLDENPAHNSSTSQ